MEQSRRELLKFASIAGACSVLPANVFAADSNPSSGAKPWQERISRSVVENATNAVAAAASAGRQVTPEKMRVAAFATRTLTDHLEEVGWTSEHDSAVREFLTAPRAIPAQTLQQLSDEMRARGVNVSVGELRRRLELDDDRRWAVAGRIQSEGLAATLSAASTALEQVASRLTTASGEPQTTSIRTEDVFDDMCRELRLIADAILAIAALDALGCAFGCPFCCLIAIGFGVVGALMMLAVDFIC